MSSTDSGGSDEEQDEDLAAPAETTGPRRPAAPEDDESDAATDYDPVRMYLRGMVSIALLTREGEVYGQRAILEHVNRRKAELSSNDCGEREVEKRARPLRVLAIPFIQLHPGQAARDCQINEVRRQRRNETRP